MVRFRTSVVSLVALVALAACSDAPSATEPTLDAAASAARKPKPTPTQPTSPTSPTSPSTGATVTGCEGSTVSLSADEKTSLDLHNAKRTQLGLRTFCVHPALQAAARAHSADMLAQNYFSHNSISGIDWYTRIGNFGYPGVTRSENIGWGTGSMGTADYLFNAWLGSPGHYAAIANPAHLEIGIGVSYGTFMSYSGASVWTVDFGAR